MSEQLSAEERESLARVMCGKTWDGDKGVPVLADLYRRHVDKAAPVLEAILTARLASRDARLAAVEVERDSAQEHLAYHLQDFHPGADMKATGDLAVDMAAYAGRLKARLVKAEALIPDWQANGNSRELGDPTDAVWFKCAEQLLAALRPDPSEASTDA